MSGLVAREDATTESIQTSPLLSLPPELRNNIYSFALTPTNETPENEIEVPADGRLAHPSLLKVCKQITEEATELYYATTTFYLSFTPSDLSPVKSWLDIIGTKNATVIDRVVTVLDAHKEQELIGRQSVGSGGQERKWDKTVAVLLQGGIRGSSIVPRHPSAIRPCEDCGQYHIGSWPTWMRTPVPDMAAAIERAEAVLED
ncbi:hypothetical protein LTR85_005835 [Meristemomyces frigidus]|nr:hypothetical protein LTR85_005835 [Meristemomyces frigidus]